jgi:hypothetical protein
VYESHVRLGRGDGPEFPRFAPDLNGAQANAWLTGRDIPRWVLVVLFFVSIVMIEGVTIGLIVLL